MLIKCLRCSDVGNYRDPRCREKKCAHRERVVLEWRTVVFTEHKFGKATQREKEVPAKFGKRKMNCPLRTCVCPAGKRKRTKVAQILEQRLKP